MFLRPIKGFRLLLCGPFLSSSNPPACQALTALATMFWRCSGAPRILGSLAGIKGEQPRLV